VYKRVGDFTESATSGPEEIEKPWRNSVSKLVSSQYNKQISCGVIEKS
jgi:hypothetical protein